MSIELQQPNVVVPTTDLATLRALAAAGASPTAWDIVEARLDQFGDPGELVAPLRELRQPVLLTPRHPDEGGDPRFGQTEIRRAAVEPLLPDAGALDVEVAHAEAMAPTIELARSGGLSIVLSFHDFEATPSASRLADVVSAAGDRGADVVKLATRTRSGDEVARLIDLLGRFADRPLAVMGMGPLGMASRLLAAGCGSVLNYAAHGAAVVEGQWPVAEFRELLERTGARRPRR